MSKSDHTVQVTVEIGYPDTSRRVILLSLAGLSEVDGHQGFGADTQPYFVIPEDPNGEFYFWPKGSRG